MKRCWYNEIKLYGCSGVLNALENDCGCRKSSHFNWYIKTGQVNTVQGSGNLDLARFFEGFEFENPNVKGKFKPTFCGPSRFAAYHRPVKYFMSSSKPKFELVYTSSINSSDTRYLMYYENSRIGLGDRFYYGGDWLVTPPPYLYLIGKKTKDAWVSLGLVVKKGEYNFNFFEYSGGEGWGLTLDYDGYTSVDGSWESPKILFEMSDDVYKATESHVSYLRQHNYVNKNNRTSIPRWWKEPIFGGWGEQMFHANHWEHYNTSRSFGWSGGSADLCTMQAYDQMLETLEHKGVLPTILIVDNRWFKKDCQMDVDEQFWPDMKGWIAKQHSKGRKVILWVSPFSYGIHTAGSDVPLSEHIILDPAKNKRLEIDTEVFYTAINQRSLVPKKKIASDYVYGGGVDIKKESIKIDVLNPSYEARLRKKIQYLLSPDGLDADGFEFDYTHFGPNERGYRRVMDGPMIYGAELVYKLLGIYYDQAKKAKPDALIITHTFNPYFDDIVDMLRLQDIYTDNASIVDQMTHRARVAKIVCPGCVVHTDQHPMPSLAAWREYAEYQSSIGNPCLYYVTGIETTKEKFTEEDYKLLQNTWNRHHAKLDSESSVKY